MFDWPINLFKSQKIKLKKKVYRLLIDHFQVGEIQCEKAATLQPYSLNEMEKIGNGDFHTIKQNHSTKKIN